MKGQLYLPLSAGPVRIHRRPLLEQLSLSILGHLIHQQMWPRHHLGQHRLSSRGVMTQGRVTSAQHKVKLHKRVSQNHLLKRSSRPHLLRLRLKSHQHLLLPPLKKSLNHSQCSSASQVLSPLQFQASHLYRRLISIPRAQPRLKSRSCS